MTVSWELIRGISMRKCTTYRIRSSAPTALPSIGHWPPENRHPIRIQRSFVSMQSIPEAPLTENEMADKFPASTDGPPEPRLRRTATVPPGVRGHRGPRPPIPGPPYPRPPPVPRCSRNTDKNRVGTARAVLAVARSPICCTRATAIRHPTRKRTMIYPRCCRPLAG